MENVFSWKYFVIWFFSSYTIYENRILTSYVLIMNCPINLMNIPIGHRRGNNNNAKLLPRFKLFELKPLLHQTKIGITWNVCINKFASFLLQNPWFQWPHHCWNAYLQQRKSSWNLISRSTQRANRLQSKWKTSYKFNNSKNIFDTKNREISLAHIINKRVELYKHKKLHKLYFSLRDLYLKYLI